MTLGAFVEYSLPYQRLVTNNARWACLPNPIPGGAKSSKDYPAQADAVRHQKSMHRVVLQTPDTLSWCIQAVLSETGDHNMLIIERNPVGQ